MTTTKAASIVCTLTTDWFEYRIGDGPSRRVPLKFLTVAPPFFYPVPVVGLTVVRAEDVLPLLEHLDLTEDDLWQQGRERLLILRGFDPLGDNSLDISWRSVQHGNRLWRAAQLEREQRQAELARNLVVDATQGFRPGVDKGLQLVQLDVAAQNAQLEAAQRYYAKHYR